MNDKIYMHITTYNWLINNIERYNSSVPVFYSGNILSFSGFEIVVDNSLSPTIDEGEGWIFPKEPFVRYEQKDKEWCKYFGIGRQGRGFIIGDVVCTRDFGFNLKVDQMFKRKGYNSYCWKEMKW